MRVLLAQRLIFLCNPKCASESIRKVLDPHADYSGGKRGSIGNHADMRDVERFLAAEGHDAGTFEVFTTIRNPWARVVSLYHYGIANPKSVWHAPATEAGSFRDFCFGPHLRTAFTPKRESNERSVDIVSFGSDSLGRFRPTVFDVDRLHEAEGWLRVRGVEATIPHINRTQHEHYRAYYDEESRREVEDIFQTDIAFAGYVF